MFFHQINSPSNQSPLDQTQILIEFLLCLLVPWISGCYDNLYLFLSLLSSNTFSASDMNFSPDSAVISKNLKHESCRLSVGFPHHLESHQTELGRVRYGRNTTVAQICQIFLFSSFFAPKCSKLL